MSKADESQLNSRRAFLMGLGAGALALTLPGCRDVPDDPPQRPNILFIMTDDHTVQAMSCYGSRINRTPNLDRLAREGVRFEQGFCTNAICGPSRATLLTGKYSHENGMLVNGTPFDGTQMTFPKLLREAGYETAMIGKWHLESEPTGFDYWNILPGQGHYYNPDFIRMGKRVRVPGYATDLITDDSLEWLEARDGEKPFCLLLHHKAPHRNWMPGPKHLSLYADEDIPIPENYFDDYDSRSDAAREQKMSIARDMYDAYDLKLPLSPKREFENGRVRQDREMWLAGFNRLSPEQKAAWEAAYDPENIEFEENPPEGRALEEWKYQRYIKDYLRCVASVDENIGRVLDYLDESGLAGNTVVVYTSDQGFFLGEHGWFDKRFMYSETHGIPLLVRYPPEIAPRVDTDHMILNADFAPTFLDYAGVRVPGEMQGRSLRDILGGDTKGSWRNSVYYHYFEYPGPHAVKRHYGVRTKQYILIHFYYDIDAWELYDLEKDPAEMQNVYDDPAYAEVVIGLKAELARLRTRYRDTDEVAHLPKSPGRQKHLALGCPVVLAHPYTPKYAAGGPGALTDGVVGPDSTLLPDYRPWQGFEQVDLDAVVDLGRVIPIDEVSLGCLQHIGSWIFLPRGVSFSGSKDGKTFEKLGFVGHKCSSREGGCFRYEITLCPGDGVGEWRYLRLVAESVGTCPNWHPGAGGKAWIFADEIVVL